MEQDPMTVRNVLFPVLRNGGDRLGGFLNHNLSTDGPGAAEPQPTLSFATRSTKDTKTASLYYSLEKSTQAATIFL
jgi:hypothetical protein